MRLSAFFYTAHSFCLCICARVILPWVRPLPLLRTVVGPALSFWAPLWVRPSASCLPDPRVGRELRCRKVYLDHISCICKWVPKDFPKCTDIIDPFKRHHYYKTNVFINSKFILFLLFFFEYEACQMAYYLYQGIINGMDYKSFYIQKILQYIKVYYEFFHKYDIEVRKLFGFKF